MLTAISECPASIELAAFFDRKLSEDENEEVRTHLDDCEDCLSTMAFFLKGSQLGGSVEPSANITDIEPGTRVGPFELQSLLGVGNLGRVYAALDTRLQREIALKLLGTRRDHPDWAARLVKEAQTMRRFAIPMCARSTKLIAMVNLSTSRWKRSRAKHSANECFHNASCSRR